MVMSIIVYALSFVCIKKAAEYIYPAETNNVYNHLTYLAVDIYITVASFIQKRIKRIYKFLNSFKSYCIITFVKNGHEMRECNLAQLPDSINALEHYDLIIYKVSDNKIDNYNYNIVILTPDSIKNESYKNITTSSMSFLDIKVVYNTNTYPIMFDDCNYYIVGNVLLDRAFIQWFLNNKYGVIIEEDLDYTCIIMDNYINIVELHSSNYVIIENDSYLVVNILDSEPDNTLETDNTLKNNIIC